MADSSGVWRPGRDRLVIYPADLHGQSKDVDPPERALRRVGDRDRESLHLKQLGCRPSCQRAPRLD
jgi:hypothetical protein